MNDKQMRVLIADDQPQVCSALRLILMQEPDIAIVGEAKNVEQALERVTGQRPDLVLLDWELQGQNGDSALIKLRKVQPGLFVIALSGRPEARQAALTAGADAFVSKGDPPERLLAVVDEYRPK